MQATRPLLTAEGDLMSAKKTITEAQHPQALLHDLSTPRVGSISGLNNSQAAYQASIGESFSKPLNHVNVALKWVCGQLRDNHVQLVHIKSIHLHADFLTMILPV